MPGPNEPSRFLFVCPPVRKLLFILVFAAGSAAPAPGQEKPALGHRILHALERDSAAALVATQYGFTMVGALLLDESMRETLRAQDASSFHPLSRVGNHLGRGERIAVLLAASYGGSRLLGADDVSRPLGKTLAALLTAGVANGTLKFAAGRARPRAGAGEGSFRPFSLEDSWQSFPSGHVVTAFSLATAIAEQADRPWVTGAAYGTAAMVGWSRVHEDRHWASDVVGGAILGTLVARYTVRRLEAREAPPGAVPRPLRANPLAGARLHPTPYGLVVVVPTR
jgi:membrane-associated phospholipid phosphatase